MTGRLSGDEMAIAVTANESPVTANAIAAVAIEFPRRAKGKERKGESDRTSVCFQG